MHNNLADLILGAQGDLPTTAVVDSLNLDGTINLRYLGGYANNVPVVASYVPAGGDIVRVIRTGRASLLVLGPMRTANTTSTNVAVSYTVAYNIDPVPQISGGFSGASGTATYLATNSGAYRSIDKWSSRNELRQGSYSGSASLGYYSGCWFYGSGAFSGLKGRGISRVRLTMRRLAGTGNYGAEPVYVYTTKNATKPSGAPYFVTYVGSYKLTTVASGSAPQVTVDLPTSVGRALRDGTALGLGIKYNGTSDYLGLTGQASDANSGRLLIDWTE